MSLKRSQWQWKWWKARLLHLRGRLGHGSQMSLMCLSAASIGTGGFGVYGIRYAYIMCTGFTLFIWFTNSFDILCRLCRLNLSSRCKTNFIQFPHAEVCFLRVGVNLPDGRAKTQPGGVPRYKEHAHAEAEVLREILRCDWVLARLLNLLWHSQHIRW